MNNLEQAISKAITLEANNSIQVMTEFFRQKTILTGRSYLTDIWHIYITFCQAQKITPLSKITFYYALVNLGIEIKACKPNKTECIGITIKKGK